jgi:quinol-cytochrome oxidoreductase complex cytochrome b subunit
MPDRHASPALSASAVALLLCGAGVLMFLPPLVDQTVASIPRTVLFGLVIASSLVLHFIFLGIAVRRQGRRVALWVGLALMTLPVASIVALVLLAWHEGEARAGLMQHG